VLEKNDINDSLSVTMQDCDFEDLIEKEWLLTNSRGGFASSTLACCNSRKYHGLLIASVSPPVKRTMSLNCICETVKSSEGQYDLTGMEFDGASLPKNTLPVKFYQDSGVHFTYRLGSTELTKSIYLVRDENCVAVVYDFLHIDGTVELTLRPFISLRNFHHLQKSSDNLYMSSANGCLRVRHNIAEGNQLQLRCPDAVFEEDQQWWYNVMYRVEKERGEDYREDLWAPGVFRAQINCPKRIVFIAYLETPGFKTIETSKDFDIDLIREELARHREQIITKSNQSLQNNCLTQLALAADQFLARRLKDGKYGWTILAGFPWFGDWGRDTFIALPGLLLSTGRFEEAKSVLMTFAESADGGMIPNYFDEHTSRPEYNSIDASLWFINSSFEYLKASSDRETFLQNLLPAIRWIVESYQQGCRYGIRVDDDGLVTGGDIDTQLTWMDAKYNGHSFTPRHGKPVEVNALWYNALRHLSDFYASRNGQVAANYRAMADKTRGSFIRLFWNEIMGYLNDCILPDGQIDASLRPNQIFAVSLPFSPLEDYQARCVVDIVEKRLLTPYGLRTLDVCDSRYKGTYSGPPRQRDEAYHQGTVWPYLIGPFVEAYLKVNGFSPKSKQSVAAFLEPLLNHIAGDSCIGQVNEIFDGDSPHRPRGCFAQAWSVAELIRAYLLINS